MTPLVAFCLWVLAAAGVAMLPLRRQYLPGAALLAAAPVLAVWLGLVHGVALAALALAAVLSMFRKPLIHLAKRAVRRPEEDAR